MAEPTWTQDNGRLLQVRVCRMANGERLPLVVKPDHLHVSTPSHWMLFLRRPQVQAGTLTDEMRTIAHVHERAAWRGIKDRFTSGNGLLPDEANAPYQNLLRADSRLTNGGTQIDRRRRTRRRGGCDAERTVAIARDYLVLGLERTLSRFDVGDPRLTSIRDRCDVLRRQSREFRPSVSEQRPDRFVRRYTSVFRFRSF